MLWVCDGSRIDHASVCDVGLAVRIPEWIRLCRHHGSTLTPNHGIRGVVCLFAHTMAQLGQTPAGTIHITNRLTAVLSYSAPDNFAHLAKGIDWPKISRSMQRRDRLQTRLVPTSYSKATRLEKVGRVLQARVVSIETPGPYDNWMNKGTIT
jgi:hypothetical protein